MNSENPRKDNDTDEHPKNQGRGRNGNRKPKLSQFRNSNNGVSDRSSSSEQSQLKSGQFKGKLSFEGMVDERIEVEDLDPSPDPVPQEA